MSSHSHEHHSHAPVEVACFVVTSSDTRDARTDESGEILCELLTAAGHRIVGRAIIHDEPAELRRVLEVDAPAAGAQAVVITGGTGLGKRDTTVETLEPLLEKRLDGFGELFRMLSFEEIGTRAMLSRALAGTVRGMLVFALPGSPNAARLAATKLIVPELGHAQREIARDSRQATGES